MLSIAISCISIIIARYILKKFKQDLAIFESELFLSLKEDESSISSSYEAIQKALENQPGNIGVKFTL